jgi:hypothetical protein
VLATNAEGDASLPDPIMGRASASETLPFERYQCTVRVQSEEAVRRPEAESGHACNSTTRRA